MKIIILLMFSITIFASTKNSDWESYRNYENYKKDSNNFILLYFYSPSCSYCRKLNNQLANQKVKKLLKKFKKIKINTKGNKEEQDLAKKFSIRGVPVILLVNKDKKKLVLQGITKEPLIDRFKKSLKSEILKIKNQREVPKVFAPKVDPRNIRKSYKMIAEHYNKEKNYKDAIIYLKKLEKLDQEDLYTQFELGKARYNHAKELKGSKNGVEKIKLLKSAKENLENALTKSRGYLGRKELNLVKTEINNTIKTKNK